MKNHMLYFHILTKLINRVCVKCLMTYTLHHQGSWWHHWPVKTGHKSQESASSIRTVLRSPCLQTMISHVHPCQHLLLFFWNVHLNCFKVLSHWGWICRRYITYHPGKYDFLFRSNDSSSKLILSIFPGLHIQIVNWQLHACWLH